MTKKGTNTGQNQNNGSNNTTPKSRSGSGSKNRAKKRKVVRFEDVIKRIAEIEQWAYDGKSKSDIAGLLGISPTSLSRYIHQAESGDMRKQPIVDAIEFGRKKATEDRIDTVHKVVDSVIKRTAEDTIEYEMTTSDGSMSNSKQTFKRIPNNKYLELAMYGDEKRKHMSLDTRARQLRNQELKEKLERDKENAPIFQAKMILEVEIAKKESLIRDKKLELLNLAVEAAKTDGDEKVGQIAHILSLVDNGVMEDDRFEASDFSEFNYDPDIAKKMAEKEGGASDEGENKQ